MVLASVSVLSILVTEFVYIAQVSQLIAFGGLDQTKAHYLAKSGLKIALLRLKAYQQVSKNPAVKALGAPAGLLQKIWSFPFFYPFPTNIPGMNSSDKAAIEKFQKESSMDGKFSINIESESSKYNLNLLVPGYAPSPTAAVTQTGTPPGGTPPTTQPTPTPTAPGPAPSFDPLKARESLGTFLSTMVTQRSETDADFAQNYRDFRIDDFVDVVVSWVDRTNQRRTPTNLDKVPMKKAPFYSLSELHMLPMLDDELYQFFAPSLTVNRTPGINVNTMQEPLLRAIAPYMTKEEVTEFFKFRDSLEADNTFTAPEKFYEYLSKNVAAYKSQQALTDLKNDFKKRSIELIIDETQFKITIRADAGTAARTIEAWVTLGTATPSTQSTNPQNPTGGATPPPATPPLSGPGTPQTPLADSGLKITFMKVY
jgi:hypothetical protein